VVGGRKYAAESVVAEIIAMLCVIVAKNKHFN
jgi:hypothetical protein